MSLDANQRRGMVADIARRLALCSDDELEMVDRNLLVIERARDHAEHVAEWDDAIATSKRRAT